VRIGRQFRLLNVLGRLQNREGLGIEGDFSLPPKRVIRSLNQIIECAAKPFAIRVDKWGLNTSAQADGMGRRHQRICP